MNRKVFVVVLLAALMSVVVWFFSGIFLYIVISLIIATALRPIVNFIARFEVAGFPVPRVAAIFVAYASMFMLFAAFVLLFVPLITDQIQIIASMDYDSASERLIAPMEKFELFLIEHGLTKNSPGFIVDGLRQSFVDFATNLDFSMLFNQVLSVTGNIFIGIMAVGFITSFLLYEKGILRKSVISLVPNRYFEVFINTLHKIEKLLSNYLLGLLFQMFVIFSLAAIGLSVLGVKYALTIAVFAAVANVIPYLGPLIGSFFGILIGMLTAAATGVTTEMAIMVLKIVSVFSFVQVVDNVVVQPFIFSKSVKAHPLEIFVIIFVGATISGIPGMIAAIPVYTIVRVSVSELYRGSRQYQVFKIR